MISDYQKGWASRYIREAKAELTAAQKTPYMASSLILEAVRKAQTAIYYSLGEPAFVETIVREAMHRKGLIEDPVLRCLVEIERTVRQVAQTVEPSHESVIQRVEELIKIASDIVELFVGKETN
jgi:hypothetical protein